MKKFLLLAMLFASKVIFAQQDTVGLNIPIKDQKIVYEGVIEIANKPKSELYANAQKWLVEKFSNIKDVIQTQDKEQGQIVGKVNLTTTIKGRMGTPWNFLNNMIVQIDCKDNKYRYRIYSIITSLPGGGIDETPLETPYFSLLSGKWVVNKTYTKSMLVNTNIDIKGLIESLKATMGAKKDDF